MTVSVVEALTAELRIKGNKLTEDLAGRVTDWDFDLAHDQVSQLTVTVTDGGLKRWNSGLLDRGGLVTWRDLDFIVAVNEVSQGSAEEQVKLTCRARGVQSLRNHRGPHTWLNVSPAQLIKDECGKVALDVLAQDSAVRPQIQRTAEPGKEKNETESTWDVFGRLAEEEGFWLFESAGAVVFGKPSWLLGFSDLVGGGKKWRWPG